MFNPDIQSEKFIQNISKAARCLQNKEVENAYRMIAEAMWINPSAPQPHNLLGILYELIGDGNIARKHYRAAYSLDPTYRPACKNLEQSCTVFDMESRTYDFGDELNEGINENTINHYRK